MIPDATLGDYLVVALPALLLAVILGSALAGILVRAPAKRRVFRWIAASGAVLWLGGCAMIVVGMQGLAA